MIYFFVLLSFSTILLPQEALAQFDDFLKNLPELSLPENQSIGNGKIVSGLKEALRVGAENTVKTTGNAGGYLQNQAILLPKKLQTMGKKLQLAGFGPQVDELVVGMNRAAEQAAPLAKPIF